MNFDKVRTLVAVPLVAAIALVDSISWVLSFTSDLVLGGLLYLVMTVGRNKDK